MLTERMVIISGAAGGVGTVLVDRFLRNGDTVLATDAREDALEKWRARWDADAQLLTAAADVSVEAQCGHLADVAREHAGRVDILINCAGYFPFQPFEQMTSQQWRRVIDINLTSTFLMCQAMLPLLKGRGWGRIISFGSGSVYRGTAGQGHYAAAKAGLLGFSRSLAREVGGDGITVNVVTPGVTITKAVRDSFPPELLEQQRRQRALQRDQQPEDLVGPVFFLASPDANFITGQTLNVDGGNFML